MTLPEMERRGLEQAVTEADVKLHRLRKELDAAIREYDRSEDGTARKVAAMSEMNRLTHAIRRTELAASEAIDVLTAHEQEHPGIESWVDPTLTNKEES